MKYKKINNHLLLGVLSFHGLVGCFVFKWQEGLSLSFPPATHTHRGLQTRLSPRPRPPAPYNCLHPLTPQKPPPQGPKPPEEPKKDLPGSEAGGDAQESQPCPPLLYSLPHLKGPMSPFHSHPQASVLGVIGKRERSPLRVSPHCGRAAALEGTELGGRGRKRSAWQSGVHSRGTQGEGKEKMCLTRIKF